LDGDGLGFQKFGQEAIRLADMRYEPVLEKLQHPGAQDNAAGDDIVLKFESDSDQMGVVFFVRFETRIFPLSHQRFFANEMGTRMVDQSRDPLPHGFLGLVLSQGGVQVIGEGKQSNVIGIHGRDTDNIFGVPRK